MFRRRALFAALCLSFGMAGCGKPAPAGNSLSVLDNDLVDSAERGGPQANTALAPAVEPGSPMNFSGHDCRTGGRNGDCSAAEVVNAPNCGNQFTLGLGWATRLPTGVELYPGAKVIEAAGNDVGACHIRIVSYVTDAAPQAVIDWYRATAGKAGYATQSRRNGREQLVTGERSADGDAFHVTISPDADAGSSVDLIANHGA